MHARDERRAQWRGVMRSVSAGATEREAEAEQQDEQTARNEHVE